MLAVLLVAVSLGLSNFAASIGIGISGVDARTRWRVGVVFGLFEAGPPAPATGDMAAATGGMSAESAGQSDRRTQTSLPESRKRPFPAPDQRRRE